MNVKVKRNSLPLNLRPAPTCEDELHEDVADWLSGHLKTNAATNHAMNEGRRGWKTQHKMKAFKVRKGWPDIEIMLRGSAFFIELKRDKPNKTYLTKDQKECHADLKLAGCPVAVCRSLDEVIGTCMAWELV